MKIVSVLLWIVPLVAHAFLILPPPPSSSSHFIRQQQQRRCSSLISSSASTCMYSQFIEKELDLTQVTADVQAALDAAEIALEADARGKAPWRSSSLLLPSQVQQRRNASTRTRTQQLHPDQLVQDIDDALEVANETMLQLSKELEHELQQYDAMLDQAEQSSNPTSLLQLQQNRNVVFGEQAKQVLELLRKGFLKPHEYKAYVQQRKQESKQLRRQVATQARLVMEEKQRQADVIRTALIRCRVRIEKSRRQLQICSVALDGAMVGSIVGFYIWTSFPLVGTYVPLVVPMLYGSGLLACTAVVAVTSDDTNIARQFTELTKFGFVSRALLIVLRAMWNVFAAIVRTLLEAIAAIPVLLTSSIALTVEEGSEAIADGLSRVIMPIADKQRELSEKLEERRIK